MIPSTGLVVGLLALAAAWATWQFLRMVRVWRLLSGVRVVTCTATGGPAVVRVDAGRAAANTLVLNGPETRITECSLWATGGSCDQGCMQEALTRESALRVVVDHWYLHRTCVYCHRLIGTAQSFGHRAALLTPQGTTREWSELPADRLLDSLRTDSPVCWNCHVAETFRREHPDLITDRPWPKPPDRRAG
jgi:hypothetical protein